MPTLAMFLMKLGKGNLLDAQTAAVASEDSLFRESRDNKEAANKGKEDIQADADDIDDDDFNPCGTTAVAPGHDNSTTGQEHSFMAELGDRQTMRVSVRLSYVRSANGARNQHEKEQHES